MKIHQLHAIALTSLMSALLLPSFSSAAVIAGGNGSFEINNSATTTASFPDVWRLDSPTVIDGWTLYAVGGAPSSTPQADAWLIRAGATYGTASNGNFMVNVESGPDWWLGTTITGLTSGWTYTLSFDTRQRAGGGGGNFDVFVNNTLSTTGAVGNFSVAPTSTTWQTLSFDFTATSSSMNLVIANPDVTNSGFMVDNFTIVPEPSAALLGGLGLLGMLRRRRR